ncbi:MAG: hypothetical protein ACOYEV_05920 [Candidatus Nanopelagicales bacterium]
MIDFRTHVVALNLLENELAAAGFGDPQVSEQRDQQLADVSGDRDAAILGCLMDHLLTHAASDGAEMGLLRRAADLWQRGVTLFDTVGHIRTELEGALTTPTAPDAADRFNAATAGMHGLAASVAGMDTQIAKLGSEVARMAHIPEHPRQQDRPIEDWGWGDLFLARRTDAFVRMAYRLAQSPRERAAAFGLLAGSSANICGSAYVAQVVGGPRRSHRFRTRLAGNALGSWFAQTNPEVTALRDVADSIRLGNGPTPTLDAGISAYLQQCLTKTYDPARTPAPPDLQVGYQRLLEHLDLLDAFPLPLYPITPAPAFIAAIFTLTADPPTPVITRADASPPESGGAPGAEPTNYSGYTVPGGKPTPTKTDSPPESESACGSFCLGVLAFIGLLAILGGPCWEAIARGERCEYWDKYVKKNFQNAGGQPSQEELDHMVAQGQGSALTAEQVVVVAGGGQINEMVMALFRLQVHIWETLGKGRAFLSTCGLIYPDGELAFPLHQQFVAIPLAPALPLRPEDHPVANSYRFPATLPENPAGPAAFYPVGATPDVIFTGHPTASATALQTWRQIARGDQDANNLDLDADRWGGHSCWATGGSIHDDPVAVVAVAYDDV